MGRATHRSNSGSRDDLVELPSTVLCSFVVRDVCSLRRCSTHALLLLTLCTRVLPFA